MLICIAVILCDRTVQFCPNILLYVCEFKCNGCDNKRTNNFKKTKLSSKCMYKKASCCGAPHHLAGMFCCYFKMGRK
jgi:hypothetical protein